MPNPRFTSQDSLDSKIQLIDTLRRGGDWIIALRRWLQSNVPKGDSLAWNSGQFVSIPFARFEEVGLKVALAAVEEDRRTRPAYTWNPDPTQIPRSTVVLCQVKSRPNFHTYLLMANSKTGVFDQLGFILQNRNNELIIEEEYLPLSDVIRWINPATLQDRT
jgi:hypothetical protein